jgi:hypothetical protein
MFIIGASFIVFSQFDEGSVFLFSADGNSSLLSSLKRSLYRKKDPHEKMDESSL